MRKVPAKEMFWIGEDFSGHVGNDNIGREGTISRYGYGNKKNGEELMACAIVNMYHQKGTRSPTKLEVWSHNLTISSVAQVTRIPNTAKSSLEKALQTNIGLSFAR